MTTTDLKQGTLAGIHAVYRDTRYDVRLLGSYFPPLEDAWRACLELALQKDSARAESDFDRVLRQQLGRYWADLEAIYKEQMAELTELHDQLQHSQEGDRLERRERQERLERRMYVLNHERQSEFTRLQVGSAAGWRQYPISLGIEQLRIGSPMDITLAVVQGGGAAGMVAYSIHLLVHVMRDPKRVGAWLPRLRAGWHEGMTEMERARQAQEEQQGKRKRRNAEPTTSSRLIAAGEALSALPATEVTAIGAGEPPQDIVAAFTE